MAGLEETRERLYAKQPPVPPPRREAIFRPPGADGVRPEWEDEPRPGPRLMDRFYLARLKGRRLSLRTTVTLALLALVAVAAFIGYIILFSRSNVFLEVLGPEQVIAGEPTIITLRIGNRSSVELKDGAVTLALPPGAVFSGQQGEPSFEPVRLRLPVDDIPAGGEFQREFRIQFLGRSGEVERISALFLYRPENIQSALTRRGEYAAPIVRVPVVITVDAPEEVNAGQEVSVTIGVDAETSVPVPGMTLGIEFPPGFKLISADPASPADPPNLWPIGELAAGTSTRITLRGILDGDPEEFKPFSVRLGRYDAASQSWLLLTERSDGPSIASPFLFVQTVLAGGRKGVIEPGTFIPGIVSYRNNLAQPLQNVTIAVSFPEQFVELATLHAVEGFYDVAQRMLVWNPASSKQLSELAAGEQGSFAFSFTVKSDLPIRSFSDKNFVFGLTATIDAGTPPPGFRGVPLLYRDRAEFQIASRLTLAARATYYDSPIQNSGPLPPRVRQATTYTLFLQLGSGANDVEDVVVRGVVPGGIEFRGAFGGDIGTVEFNPASRELVWRVGRLAAATGILRPHAAAIVQVALVPTESQVQTSPSLLTDIAVRGRDSFTGRDLSAAAESVATELRSDARSNVQEWRVAP